MWGWRVPSPTQSTFLCNFTVSPPPVVPHPESQPTVESVVHGDWKTSCREMDLCSSNPCNSRVNCIFSHLVGTLTCWSMWRVGKAALVSKGWRAKQTSAGASGTLAGYTSSWDLRDVSPEPPRAYHLPADYWHLDIHFQSTSLFFASVQTFSKTVCCFPSSFPSTILEFILKGEAGRGSSTNILITEKLPRWWKRLLPRLGTSASEIF